MKLNSETLLPIVIEELNLGKKVTFKVKGHSMWPFFKDSITDVTLKTSTYRKWDVVLAKYQNQFVLHRIIKVYDDGFILRGDGSVRKEFVLIENVYGKVVFYKTKKQIIESSKFNRLKVKLWVLNPFRRLLLRFK